MRSRASAASASDTRARTSSDFTLGTVVSIASAIWSYESASISRRSSAVRWVSGSSPTSATIWRNSSRLCTVSAVLVPPSRSNTSIESWPAGCGRRRWFSERLRAIRYSHGRALIGRSSREHRVERGGEDLLEHVLGVLLRAEHVAAEGEQARLIALDQRLERAVVAAARERDQALVTLKPEERRAPRKGGQRGVTVGERKLPCGGRGSGRAPLQGTP